MDKSTYKVDREDYAGFTGQLNKSKCDVEQKYEEHQTTMTIRSKKTGKILCIHTISDEGIDEYYVVNMPDNDERVAPKPIRQIVLKTKEEVLTFFDILSKIQKGEVHDGDIC